MSYTSNLISSKIDKALANKITANSWGKMFSTTLYISNSGNDGTADGSQEKPFATITNALLYVQRNYKLVPNNQLTIKFLSDYTITGNLYIFELAGISGNTKLVIDGAGFNVVFKVRLYVASCTLELKNITIESKQANQDALLFLAFNSVLYISEKVNLHLKHSGCNIIVASENSILYNKSAITVSADKGIIGRSFCRFYGFSKVRLFSSDDASVTINDVTFSLAVFDGFRYALVETTKQIQGTANGRKYFLVTSASLDIGGQGEDYLVGSEAGYADTETNCWVK